MKIELDGNDTFRCTECGSQLEWRMERQVEYNPPITYKAIIIRVEPCPKCQRLARELGEGEK